MTAKVIPMPGERVEWYCGNHLQAPRKSLSALLQEVADAADITPAQILGTQKNRSVVAARWRLIGEAFELGFSQSEIGRFLSRDHTTIGNALRKLGYLPQKGVN
jgi:chromosomal replication initiation ATPase DnaA